MQAQVVGRIDRRLKRGVVASGAALVTVCVFSQYALAITVQVSTIKPLYYAGEVAYISVTVPETATLYFPTSCQASYLVDQVYAPPIGCLAIETSQTTPHTWILPSYDLGLGNHSVVGEVIGYGFSAPTNFQIIPAPPPPADFRIDFDTIPGTTAQIAFLKAYAACGARAFIRFKTGNVSSRASIRPTAV